MQKYVNVRLIVVISFCLKLIWVQENVINAPILMKKDMNAQVQTTMEKK